MRTAVPERGPLLGWQESRAVMRRLRTARRQAGLQAVDVSAAAGWQRGRVSQMEAMVHRVYAADAELLAGLLGTPVADLLAREAAP